MNELALFAGAGGGLLGTHLLGWTPVCAVEREPYCREVLLRRQRDGMLPLFPIWDDAKTFDGRPWRGLVDVVTAGFPCQHFSTANSSGKKAENLWPDTLRIIAEVRPDHILLENVVGIRRYLPVVRHGLQSLGYCVRPRALVAAASVGAPHPRRRVWILAHAHHTAELRLPEHAEVEGSREAIVPSNADCLRVWKQQRRSRWPSRESQEELARHNWWSREPGMARVDDGMANRLDRNRAIGNGQVPAVVSFVWSETMKEKR